MDGQALDIQETKDHTIAQQEVMFALDVLSLMLITNVVFMLDLKFLELMPRLCQDNGSSKLDQLKVSKLEIIYGLLDIYLTDVLKNTTCLLVMNQKSSQIGMVQDVTPISQLKL
jgi:hypothetical protein